MSGGKDSLFVTEKRVLLHSCCATCAGAIMETLMHNGVDLTVFFYNPNIHPRQEYELRKKENIRFARKNNILFVDADYDDTKWFFLVKGLENEPERGERCTVCFDVRLEQTAAYAYEHGFKVFATTLGLSRWKNLDQVNACGRRAAEKFPGLTFLAHNWRKGGVSQRMVEIARQEQFYRQEYCGCIYSFRDTNKWRQLHGREPIEKSFSKHNINI